MEKEIAPEFRELRKIKFDQDWWTDPPEILSRIFDENQLKNLAQLEIQFRIKDLENRLEFYNKLPKI